MGFLQVPQDKLRCAFDACPADVARSAVLQQMHQGGQPRDVLCRLGRHIPDRRIAAIAAELTLDGVVGLYPCRVCR